MRKLVFKELLFVNILILFSFFDIVYDIGVVGPYYIQNLGNCLVLDIKDGNMDAGTQVVLSPLEKKHSQRWKIWNVGNGYMIHHPQSCYLLDVKHGGFKNCSNAIIWLKSDACNQRWIFDFDRRIRNGRCKFVLDVCENKCKKLPNVVVKPRNKNNVYQQWRLIPAGSIVPYQF